MSNCCRITTLVLFALITAICTGVAASRLQAQVEAPAAGTWTGTIAAPGTPLGITVTLQRGAGGVWTGTMDIPAQSARGLPLGDIVVEGQSVSFRLLAGAGNPAVKAVLSADGARISGTFSQGGGAVPLELARGAAAETKPAARPQEPKRPFPYRDEEVSYRNPVAQNTLAGTLTMPSSGGPFPAALLITGSGQQDRDETILGHKPFLVLSDHLTRLGFAVLRVDDRGVGGSSGPVATATSADFAGDVQAGVAYLRGRREIDPKRVGLIGHSEGANIASMVAASMPDISFMVMMAGTGIGGDEILYMQAAAVGRLQGASDALVGWDRSIRQGVYALIKSETNGVPDEARRRALLEAAPSAPGNPDASSGRTLAATLLKAGSSPWFRYFLAFDPAPTLAKVRCPVLAIIGENDLQVPYRQNLPAILAALEAGGNRDHTVTSLPRLNHLFQTSSTGAPAEYGSIEETIAPAALELVSNWMLTRTRR